MELKIKLPQHNAIPNIPENLPEANKLLEMVDTWPEQDFQDKCNIEYGEIFGEEALAKRIEELEKTDKNKKQETTTKIELEKQKEEETTKKGPIKRL